MNVETEQPVGVQDADRTVEIITGGRDAGLPTEWQCFEVQFSKDLSGEYHLCGKGIIISADFCIVEPFNRG